MKKEKFQVANWKKGFDMLQRDWKGKINQSSERKDCMTFIGVGNLTIQWNEMIFVHVLLYFDDFVVT